MYLNSPHLITTGTASVKSIESIYSGSSASESLESVESGLGDSKANVFQSSLLRKAIIHWTDIKKGLMEMEKARTELEIAKRGNFNLPPYRNLF